MHITQAETISIKYLEAHVFRQQTALAKNKMIVIIR